MLFFGFYCPKGFIFLQGGRTEVEVGKELAVLVDLPSDSTHNFLGDVLHFVRHDCSYHSKCQYQVFDLTYSIVLNGGSVIYNDVKCIRQQIHVLWMRIFNASKWVQSLIKKSDEIFQCIVTSNLSEVFYDTLKQKGVEHVNASSFARLRMVMRVRSELTAWLSHLSLYERFDLHNDANVTTSIHDNEFWNDGNQLVQVIAPFYKVPSLMDTLVPSAGYLELAIDKASSLLKTYSESEPLKYKQIWECFQIWRFSDTFLVDQDLACYLNPSYTLVGQDLKEDIVDMWLERLYVLALTHEDEDEQKVVDAEVDAYCTKSSNPFAGVSEAEFEANHPLTLWSKYGGGFPLLQKCAYILLSQPGCCLCKQVEKFASKVIGSDNFILRLNGLMMEEFAQMGDQMEYDKLEDNTQKTHSSQQPLKQCNAKSSNSSKKRKNSTPVVAASEESCEGSSRGSNNETTNYEFKKAFDELSRLVSVGLIEERSALWSYALNELSKEDVRVIFKVLAKDGQKVAWIKYMFVNSK